MHQNEMRNVPKNIESQFSQSQMKTYIINN
jgi:hypothetical protein